MKLQGYVKNKIKDDQIKARRGYGLYELPELKLDFLVEGRPVGKERPRIYKNGGRETPKRTKDYEARIASICSTKMGNYKPFEGNVCVEIVHFSKTKKFPDLDNVIKTILDGMNGVVYKDDRQVADIKAKRVIAGSDYIAVEVRGVLTHAS